MWIESSSGVAMFERGKISNSALGLMLNPESFLLPNPQPEIPNPKA